MLRLAGAVEDAQRAPDRPGRRRGCARAAGRAARRSTGSRPPPATASAGRVGGTRGERRPADSAAVERAPGPHGRRGRRGAGPPRGWLSVADAVKPTSAEAVRRLRELGLRPVLLTGDHASVAHRRRRRGRHRRGRRRRRRAARRQGRRREAAAGRGPGRRDGRRRRQRRRRARPGRPRAGDGHRHRRRHRGRRPDPGARRPAGRGRRDPALPPDPDDHQGQPVLGVRLQRRRAARSPPPGCSTR